MAADTIRFIVTVAIVVYKGLIPVVGRMLTAVLLCAISKIFSPMTLSNLIASEKVYSAVIDYLDWRIWGLMFSFPFLALRSFLVGITLTKPLNKAAFTAVLVNIPCNWLLIFYWCCYSIFICRIVLIDNIVYPCFTKNGQNGLWSELAV